jgi:hypothetical protein
MRAGVRCVRIRSRCLKTSVSASSGSAPNPCLSSWSGGSGDGQAEVAASCDGRGPLTPLTATGRSLEVVVPLPSCAALPLTMLYERRKVTIVNGFSARAAFGATLAFSSTRGGQGVAKRGVGCADFRGSVLL